MKKTAKIFLLIFTGLTVILGTFHCSKQTGPQKIDEKKFVRIYCDVVSYSDLIDSKLRQALVDSVFENYKVTKEDFHHTVNSYTGEKNKWKKVFEKIVAELERRSEELEPKAESPKKSDVIKETKKREKI